MRTALVALAVLAAPAAVFAQPGSYLAVVTDPELKVRAGPGDKFPDTGTVVKGDRVLVAGEEPGGWLAVWAPQGSVSWVQNTFIDFNKDRPVPQNVKVEDGTTLAAGRVGLPQPLTEVRRAKVPEGTALVVIGAPATFEGKKWYPVVPPFGDFRYVPKTGVQAERAVNTSFVVRGTDSVTPAGAPAGGSPAGGVAGAAGQDPPRPTVSHPLWAQAEAAERDGRYDEAERLYFQLARLMNEPNGDHDVANLCYTRIHTLREKRRGGGTTTWTAPRDDRPALQPPARDDRAALPPPAREERPAPSAKTTDAASRPTTGNTTQPVGTNPAPPDDRPRWAGAGVLSRTALAIDGRRTYALESSPGVVRMYVVGAPGVDLEKYINRRVDVFGSTFTRRDLSKAYMVVTAIEPNP